MVEKYGDLGANSGSREPSRVAPSRPIGFDPERMVLEHYSAEPVFAIQSRQQGDIGGKIIAPYVWKHRLDGPISDWYYLWDCASGVIWNAAAIAAIAAGSGTAKTPEAVECEASQSGGIAASPDPHTDNHS